MRYTTIKFAHMNIKGGTCNAGMDEKAEANHRHRRSRSNCVSMLGIFPRNPNIINVLSTYNIFLYYPCLHRTPCRGNETIFPTATYTVSTEYTCIYSTTE